MTISLIAAVSGSLVFAALYHFLWREVGKISKRTGTLEKVVTKNAEAICELGGDVDVDNVRQLCEKMKESGGVGA